MLTLLLMLLLGPSARADEATAFGQDVAAVARRYRDTRPKLRINACNGLIEDILRDAGLEMRGGVRHLYAQMKEEGWIHRRKHPLPGDIVFFDKTYDANKNGRQDEPLTHVAVVISVDADGTIHMVHRGSKGIRPLTMNLSHRSTRRRDSDSKVLNSWLASPGYGKEGHKLAGELWNAFASPRLDVPGSRIAADTRRTGSASASSAVSGGEEPRVDAVVKLAEPRRPGPVPPLSLDDPAFARAWSGRRLRARHLDGRSCTELWFLRNTLFARHGYDFQTRSARRIFEALPDYEADPRVNGRTAAKRLSRRDRKNLDEILEREAPCR